MAFDLPPLNATLIVDGVDLSRYLIKVSRSHQLCHPGQTGEIDLSPDLDHTTILPWQAVTLYENSKLVLTGYTESIEPQRPPPMSTLRVKDTFKLATDYFIPEGLYTDEGQTATYWATYLCGLCGLSCTIEATSGSMDLVSAGMPLGLMPVADALLTISAFGRWQMSVNASGVLEFRSLPIPPSTVNWAFGQGLGWNISYEDKDTRNVAKIWGLNDQGPLLRTFTRTVPDVPLERDMLFAHPLISTNEIAAAIADAALNQFANVPAVIHQDIIGQPLVRVGHTATSAADGGASIHYITDLSSVMDSKGYVQSIILNRRCPRLPGFISSGSRPDFGYGMIVQDFEQGVWACDDLSVTYPIWYNLNNGLVRTNARISSSLSRIAYDYAFSQNLYITLANGLWRMENTFSFGATFEHVLSSITIMAMTGFTDFIPWAVAVNPYAPWEVAVAIGQNSTSKGYILHSSNYGTSWTLGYAFDSAKPGSLSYSAGGLMFAYLFLDPISHAEEARVYKSTDNGATFTMSLGMGLSPLGNSQPPRLARGGAGSSVLAWYSTGVSPSDFVTWYTNNDGFTWTELTAAPQILNQVEQGAAISQSGAAMLAIQSGDNVFPGGNVRRSLDTGVTWANLSHQPGIPPTISYVFPLNPGRYIIGGEGLVISENSGNTWIDKFGNLPDVMGADPSLIAMIVLER